MLESHAHHPLCRPKVSPFAIRIVVDERRAGMSGMSASEKSAREISMKRLLCITTYHVVSTIAQISRLSPRQYTG